MRYDFTFPGLARIKKRMTGVGEDVEKLELSYTASGIITWCNCFREQLINSSKY